MIPAGITFDEATHAYTVGGKPFASVTQVIAAAGLYGDAAKYFDDYSRDRGRLVHRIIELHVQGDLDPATVDPALAGYFAAYLAFEKDTDFYPGYLEHVLYSDVLRVAGRVDMIGPNWKGEGCCIIDLKTSATPSPATGVQLAGYEELYGADPEGVKPKRLALHLGKDGKYRLHKYEDRHDRDIFIMAVSIHNWKLANLKGG